MRKIKITHYEIPNLDSHYIKQKMYSVSLGNGDKKWFTNHKDALAYLANANRELNRCLDELNYFYGIVFSEFRKNWFYFDKDNKQTERKINAAFHQISKCLEMAVERSHFENGNHFTFNHLNSSADELTKVLREIIELLEDKKHFVEVHHLEIYCDMIRFVKNNIKDVGVNFKI